MWLRRRVGFGCVWIVYLLESGVSCRRFLGVSPVFLQKCWLRYGGVSEPELSFVRGDVSCVFQLSVWVLLSWHAVSGMLVFWLSSCMAFVYHSACLIRDADRQVFCSVGGEDWSCGM